MLFHYIINRGSRKSRQKMAENTASFCKYCKNHGKVTSSSHGPEDHYTVYKTQYLASTAIISCSGSFSSVTFCRCGTLRYIFLRWRHAHILS